MKFYKKTQILLAEDDPIRGISVEEINLQNGSCLRLKQDGVKVIGDVIDKDDEEILQAFPAVGRKTVFELWDAIAGVLQEKHGHHVMRE